MVEYLRLAPVIKLPIDRTLNSIDDAEEGLNERFAKL